MQFLATEDDDTEEAVGNERYHDEKDVHLHKTISKMEFTHLTAAKYGLS